jgi:hypothetical protein
MPVAEVACFFHSDVSRVYEIGYTPPLLYLVHIFHDFCFHNMFCVVVFATIYLQREALPNSIPCPLTFLCTQTMHATMGGRVCGPQATTRRVVVASPY